MLKITIGLKQLESIFSIVRDNDTRYYCNGAGIDKANGTLVASNSETLISCRAIIEGECDQEILSHAFLKKAIAIAKAEKKTIVELEPKGADFITGRYPPYMQAAPQNERPLVSFELRILEDAIKAFKKQGTKYVDITVDGNEEYAFSRPLKIVDHATGEWGLVVPCRF